ncbi:MAG TPA: hypothetical protein VLT45_23610 [Kofleriaceae bacterium]|nr:hypothetical protein [Kofleriaceae bacterium]
MRYSLLAVAALFLGTARVEAASGCPIPGFSNAAFADTSFSASGTIDSWDSSTGAYSSATACTDPTSCTDSNSCAASIGTNASSFSSMPSTSGTCTANANVSLPIPTVPSSPTPTSLGAISGTTTVTGPGSFTATSISESGNAAVNFKTANPNGAVVVYVSGSITFSGNGALNNDSLNPSKVLIMCTGGSGQSVTLNGNGNAYFTLYCPQADITVNGGGSGGQIWGAIVGKTITGHGSHAVTIHYDKQVANMTSDAITCNVEVSRASPVVATLSGADYVIQGTTGTSGTKVALTTTNASTWTFPAYTGHMRARAVASVSSTASGYSSGSILFDANGKIPTSSAACSMGSSGLNGSCRYVFTNTNTPAGATFHPSTIAFDDTNASTIVPKILSGLSSTNQTTVLQKIRGASLGGVDRSTVAVIGPSAVAGTTSRPSIAYFGAADGMVHAVCASTDGTICTSLGTELWAFLPAVQLPLIAYNDQRIDGSVHVVDAFGDFTNNPATGARSWHTVLTFQTGYSNSAEGGKPAAYAIDVTDPSKPVLLWEYTTPATPATYDFGTGLVTAMGPTLVNGAQTNLAVLETNNGGSGTAAMVATALQLETGSKVWQFSTQYPTGASVPAAAVPGGAVGVDLTGNGFITDYVMGDLYGYLWRITASTGLSPFGTTTPLFEFSYVASTDKHPIGAVPAIYSDGNNQYVAVAAGGYADQTDGATSWSLGSHYLVSVKIKATSTPVLDTASASNSATGDLRLKLAIAASSKAYSQPTVVGDQMFVTSDTADVNASSYGANQTGTGRVLTVSGIAGTATSNSYDTATSSIYGGASSLAVGHDTAGSLVLLSSSSDKQSQVGTTAVAGAGTGVALTSGSLGAGVSVNLSSAPKLTRNIWARTL